MENKTTDFGYQDVPEGVKARKVEEVFRSVAGQYDLMNDLMSAGLHRLWKRFAVALSGVREGSRVLDVAGGTGDLARLLCKQAGVSGEVWLTDINAAMLVRGRDRLLDGGRVIPTVRCDAEKQPFPANYFDCAIVGFGLRNMTHKQTALAEMQRVLRPGGRLVIGELGRHSLWAVKRRMSGWLGSTTWRSAMFRSAGELTRLTRDAKLVVTAVRGAIYYPPCGACARWLAPIDPWLGRQTTFGAAFLAVSAAKPDQRRSTNGIPA